MKSSTLCFLVLLVLVSSHSRIRRVRTSSTANQILQQFLFSCQYNVAPSTKCASSGMLFDINDQRVLNDAVLNVRDQFWNGYSWAYGPYYNFVLDLPDQPLRKQVSDVFLSWNLSQFTSLGPLQVNGTSFNYVGNVDNTKSYASFMSFDGRRALAICRKGLSAADNYLMVALGRDGVNWRNVESCCRQTIQNYPLS